MRMLPTTRNMKSTGYTEVFLFYSGLTQPSCTELWIVPICLHGTPLLLVCRLKRESSTLYPISCVACFCACGIVLQGHIVWTGTVVLSSFLKYERGYTFFFSLSLSVFLLFSLALCLPFSPALSLSISISLSHFLSLFLSFSSSLSLLSLFTSCSQASELSML